MSPLRTESEETETISLEIESTEIVSTETISLGTETTEIGSTETECAGNESPVNEYVLCKNCIFVVFNFYLTKNRLLIEREN